MGGTILTVALAALAFVGGHVVLSSQPVRGRLVERIGERPFRGAYSVVVAVALVWLIYAFNRAPRVELWAEPTWGRAFALALMLIASVFLVSSFAAANPALAGNEPRAATAEPGKGIFAVTRHPMLWAFALWGIAHAVVNGDAASVIFFGGFTILALGGMAHIDARKRGARDQTWARVEAVTSLVPFRAMIEGRARFRFADLGWWRPFAGIALFVVLLHVHGAIIGLSALP